MPMVGWKLRIVWGLALAGLTTVAQAQSLAASLAEYENVIKVASVSGSSGTSFSGVAYQAETKTLYVVDDAAGAVYELTPAGTLLRTVTLAGFDDLEGIAYQGDDFFLFCEEGLGNVVRVKLPRAGNGPVTKASGTVLNLAPNLANSGLEGVAYRVSTRTAYAVKETGPARIWRVTVDAGGNPLAHYPDDPFSLAQKSGDAADLFALEDGNFLVVNQELGRLEGYSAQGALLSSLPLGMEKPEGIAVDASTGTLYVVGEPREFFVFRRTGTAVWDLRGRGAYGGAVLRGPGSLGPAFTALGQAVRLGRPGRQGAGHLLTFAPAPSQR